MQTELKHCLIPLIRHRQPPTFASQTRQGGLETLRTFLPVSLLRLFLSVLSMALMGTAYSSSNTLSSLCQFRGRSAKVFLSSTLPTSELVSPFVFIPSTLNETKWNETTSRDRDIFESRFGEPFLLDGANSESLPQRLTISADSKIRKGTEFRNSVNEALYALGLRTQAQSLASSKDPLRHFRTSRILSAEKGLLRSDETVGFVNPSSLLGSWHGNAPENGRAISLQSCQSRYVEHGANLNEKGFIVSEFVNVVFTLGLNQTTRWRDRNKVASYHIMLPKNRSEKEAFFSDASAFGYMAARDLLQIDTEKGEASEVYLFANRTLEDSGSNYYTFLSRTASKQKPGGRKVFNISVEIAAKKVNLVAERRKILPKDSTDLRIKSLQIDYDTRNKDLAHREARKSIEQLGAYWNGNNDVVEQVLALTALMTSIVTMLSFTQSRWKIAARAIVETLDLAIGAIPGAVIIVRKISGGHLLISPIFGNISVYPSKVVRENVTVALGEEQSVQTVHWPSYVTECRAFGARRTLDRSFFIPTYALGVMLGLLLLIAQFFVYTRRYRKERENQRASTLEHTMESLWTI